jgi:hypothetical protein
MHPERNPEELTRGFQHRLRVFQFDDALHSTAHQLNHWLSDCRTKPLGHDDGVRLKALSLLCEYLDAQGRTRDASLLAQPTGEAILGRIPAWESELERASDRLFKRRMLRQRIWCCVAYCVSLYRSNRFDEMAVCLDRLIAFTYRVLADDESFPCYGTKSQLHYYRGLLRKNRGMLNEAAAEFDLALENARLRGALKQKRLNASGSAPGRLERELLQMRGSIARIVGFGHGALALARGRFVEAKAWTAAAQELLSSHGQEIWRNGIDVYEQAATLLSREIHPNSRPAIQACHKRLSELAQWFATRNERNSALAEAFMLVAEVRLQQIVSSSRGESLLHLDLSSVQGRVEKCLHQVYRHSGSLSATAALKLIGCLLRGQRTDQCRQELDHFGRVFAGHGYATPEFELLAAELLLANREDGQAIPALLALTEKRGAQRAIRARAWAHLAACEMRQGIRPNHKLAMARETVAHVQDGYTRALVQELCDETQAISWDLLPFQRGPEDPRSLDLDWNLRLARLRMIEQAFQRHPSASVDEVARLLGVSGSWLYEFLKENKNVDWVRLLRGRRRKGKAAGA